MHELALAGAVIETAVKHAAGRPVTAVRLTVGRLRQVVPDSLAFYFELVARGTLCEGAALEQREVPARLACAACEREWEIAEPYFRCPRCAGARVTVVAGEEFLVESITVEERPEREEEAACTDPAAIA